MLDNFIYAKKKSLFENALNNGLVVNEAIVFIEDTKEIWNHGTYFDGSTFDPSNIEKSIENIINNKADKTELPTKTSDLTNDSGFITIDDIPKVTVPTKTSELTNDSGFITINDIPVLEIPDEYVTETELSNKQAKLHSYIEEIENSLVISAAIGINNLTDNLVIGLNSNTKEAVIGVNNNTNLSMITTTPTSIVVESGLADADNSGLYVDTQSARIQSKDGTVLISLENTGVMNVNADELSVNIPVVNMSDGVFVNTQTENSASILSMYDNGQALLSTTNNNEISEISLNSGDFSINTSKLININTNKLILPETERVKFGNVELDDILDDKQDILVSGTNIKTINGESLLGEGDVSISGGYNFYSETETSGSIRITNDTTQNGIVINTSSSGLMHKTSTNALARVLGINGDINIYSRNEAKTSESQITTSPDNITIETESLVLPELSKVKFGEQSLSMSSAYSLVNHGTSDTTFTLTPNTFHIWDIVTTLDLDFSTETENIANEYLFQFTSGTEPTSLSLPDTIKWASQPNIQSNKIYQISILNNLGTILEFEV